MFWGVYTMYFFECTSLYKFVFTMSLLQIIFREVLIWDGIIFREVMSFEVLVPHIYHFRNICENEIVLMKHLMVAAKQPNSNNRRGAVRLYVSFGYSTSSLYS